MSFAFEINELDVQTVLQNMGRPDDEAIAEAILMTLDFGSIEGAALAGDDMEEQTKYAYAEIKKQIEEMPAADSTPIVPSKLKSAAPAP